MFDIDLMGESIGYCYPALDGEGEHDLPEEQIIMTGKVLLISYFSLYVTPQNEIQNMLTKQMSESEITWKTKEKKACKSSKEY